jgi:hypothetical protein
VWLEFLQCLGRIVEQCKSGCLSTTKLCAKTENIDLVLIGLVHLGEFLAELIFGDVGTTWVEDVTIILY